MDIHYLGHSAFEIITNGKKILIDPFLACMPEYKPENIYNIFVTHGHGDHLGSSIDISS
jgi:L-ascorbate metabolism protein UlaG (beta-lactamase superfamily)